MYLVHRLQQKSHWNLRAVFNCRPTLEFPTLITEKYLSQTEIPMVFCFTHQESWKDYLKTWPRVDLSVIMLCFYQWLREGWMKGWIFKHMSLNVYKTNLNISLIIFFYFVLDHCFKCVATFCITLVLVVNSFTLQPSLNCHLKNLDKGA